MQTMNASTVTSALSFGKPLTFRNEHNDQEPIKPSRRIESPLMDLDEPQKPHPPASSSSSPSPTPTTTTKSKKIKTRRKWESSSPIVPSSTNSSHLLYRLIRKLSSRMSTTSLRMNNRLPILDALVHSSLLLSVVFVVSSILLFSVGGSQAQSGVFDGMCPVPECYCGLDNRGRLEVSCTSGGLKEIPTSRMSPHLELIRIVAPKGRPNQLNIGRFFRQFKKLEELHIVGSNVPNIGERNFMGVMSLKLLNLTRNNINLIVEANFIGLQNLETLSLSENQIESFVSMSFQHLPKLKVLDLSKNRIGTLVERLFYNLHVLESLDLSENRLRVLNADVFRDIWRLKQFRCQRCQLKSIPSLWYSLLPGLKKLDLRNNEFKYLGEGEFSALKSIEEILLDGNRISVLPEESFRFTRIRHLSLASNGLTAIDRTAFVNASVNTLDLSGNKFESLNKLIFLDLKHNLTKLDLSRNPNLKLSSLLIILSENTKLKWLSVSRNNYEDLPLDLFEDNRPLQHLNLSHNRLKELFPRQFNNLLNLQILDLSYNRLRGIESDVLVSFDRISTIREIRLEGNPWSCDLCHIPPLHKWIQNSPIFRKGCTVHSSPFCLRCKRPSAFYDKAIIHLDETSLEWCDPYADEYGDESRLGLFLGAGLLFLILIIIIGGLILKYQFWHSAHYYTNEATRPETGSTPPIPDYESEPVDSHMYYATINGTHTKMIATIDEKSFDPDANFYPDLTATLNPLHPSYGGRSPTTAAISPSISSKNDHYTHHHTNNR